MAVASSLTPPIDVPAATLPSGVPDEPRRTGGVRRARAGHASDPHVFCDLRPCSAPTRQEDDQGDPRPTEGEPVTNKLIGASVWERELYEHLTSHEDQERQLLVEYKEAADDSKSPAFQYLASLIIDDEIRHHRIFRELASALKTDAEFR